MTVNLCFMLTPFLLSVRETREGEPAPPVCEGARGPSGFAAPGKSRLRHRGTLCFLRDILFQILCNEHVFDFFLLACVHVFHLVASARQLTLADNDGKPRLKPAGHTQRFLEFYGLISNLDAEPL